MFPKLTHTIASLVILLRLLAYDGHCAFPTQPITWVFSNMHRIIKLSSYAPFYNSISFFFDGDFTPTMLLLIYVTLWLQGGFNSKVLWSSKVRKFCTILLFVIAPIVNAHRFYILHANRDQLNAVVFAAFGNDTLEESSLSPDIYSISHAITNKYGGREFISPNFTETFKTFSPMDTSSCSDKGLHKYLENTVHKNRVSMDNGKLGLDVFIPNAEILESRKTEKLPIVMFIHGGAWRGGDRHFFSINFNGGLPYHILEQGYILVSVSYRLQCTGATIDDMIEDLEDAVRYISDHASEWGGDGNHIIPFGGSAGGHLALVLAYRQNFKEIKGVVSLYGVTELREDELWQGISSLYELVHYPVFVSMTKKLCYVYESSEEVAACLERNTPIALVDKNTPPTLLIHGTKDPLVPIGMAHTLRDTLDRHEVNNALVEIPCSTHTCDVFCSSPCSQGTIFAMERFLYSTLRSDL